MQLSIKNLTDSCGTFPQDITSPAFVLKVSSRDAPLSYTGLPCYGSFPGLVQMNTFEWVIFLAQHQSRGSTFFLEEVFFNEKTSPWREMINLIIDNSPFTGWTDYKDFAIKYGLFVPAALLKEYARGSIMHMAIAYRTDCYAESGYIRNNAKNNPDIPLMFLYWHYSCYNNYANEHMLIPAWTTEEINPDVFTGAFVVPKKIDLAKDIEDSEAGSFFKPERKSGWKASRRPIYRVFSKSPSDFVHKYVHGNGTEAAWARQAILMGAELPLKEKYGTTYVPTGAREQLPLSVKECWDWYTSKK